MWRCSCECGGSANVQAAALKGGHSKSCGCLQREWVTAHNTTHGMGGKDRPPEFNVWIGMRDRCSNPNNKKFADYGGRGITVDPRWVNDFAAFYADMGPRPTPRHEIDRIDNEANYWPGNCRWTTRTVNLNNCRSNAYVEWRGETQTIAQWARRLGISDRTIWMRLNKLNWDVERAMTTPLRADRRRSKAA
jgi:hypothetical protein